MATLVHALLLLFAVPAILHGLGQGLMVIALYFAINVVFGALFWRRRTARLYGHASVALVYLVSGVLLFHFLITDGARELALDDRLPAAARIDQRLAKPAQPRAPRASVDSDRLVGAPYEHPHLAPRRSPDGDRQWWTRYVDLAGAFLRGDEGPRPGP